MVGEPPSPPGSLLPRSTLALSSLTSRMKETAAWGTGKLKGGAGHTPLIPSV